MKETTMSPCKVTFKPSNVVADVDTANPAKGLGVEGTLLNVALAGDVEIDHPCEGEGTCGLCQVVIEQGTENLSPASPEERDLLGQDASAPQEVRLACQAVVQGDVVCRVPD
jgi:ferredoxin